MFEHFKQSPGFDFIGNLPKHAQFDPVQMVGFEETANGSRSMVERITEC